MSELREPGPAPSPQRRVWRVGDLTRAVHLLLSEHFPSVWVEGEISNFTRHTSGHWYFTLKDAEAQLRAVMFRQENQRLRLRPEDGMKVLCRGRIGVYEKRGEYQLYVDEMEVRGDGALLVAFERLKEKLAAEGLFDAARKRSLPMLPRRVGVVTSPTGAAIRDILRVIRRRDPQMPVLLCPVRVQGDGAGGEIAQGIRRLGASGLVDVIIAGRGGGSMEDLWAFNEERVARAIVACPVPLVSAVGHEVDFTIADLAADVRAPTPSAAAEIVVPVREELRDTLAELRGRAGRALTRRIHEQRHRLEARRGRLSDPRRLIQGRRMALDDLATRATRRMHRQITEGRRRLGDLGGALRQRHPSVRIARSRRDLEGRDERLASAVRRHVATARRRFEVLAGKLQALSPLAVLARGYAIARRPQGPVVMRASEVRPEERLEVLLHEGRLGVRVEEVGSVTSQEATEKCRERDGTGC